MGRQEGTENKPKNFTVILHRLKFLSLPSLNTGTELRNMQNKLVRMIQYRTFFIAGYTKSAGILQFERDSLGMHNRSLLILNWYWKGEQEPSEGSRGHQIKLRGRRFQINERKYFCKHKDKWCNSSPQDVADAQSLHESRRKLYFLVGEKSLEDF